MCCSLLTMDIVADLSSWVFLGGRFDSAILAAAKEAEELKARGNTCFADGKYGDASDWYSRAIDTCPAETVYYEQIVRTGADGGVCVVQLRCYRYCTSW